MVIEKKDKVELKKLFDEALSNSATFKHIEGVNPSRIVFDGVEYYIFIKNLSPAQLSNGNSNIWRIQLPIRKVFEQIKELNIRESETHHDARREYCDKQERCNMFNLNCLWFYFGEAFVF